MCVVYGVGQEWVCVSVRYVDDVWECGSRNSKMCEKVLYVGVCDVRECEEWEYEEWECEEWECEEWEYGICVHVKCVVPIV